MAKERDLVFDALKIFAIFLVLWGHCIQHLTTTEATDDKLYLLIYSFHMPLFMTMVGYFSASALKMTFRELIVNKGRQLIVPSVVVGSAYLIEGVISGDMAKGVATFIDMPWFLKCTFLCFLLYYVCAHICRSQMVAILLGLLVSLAFGRFSFVWMYPCFIFGVILRRHFRLVKENAGLMALFSGIIFAGMLLFWGADFFIARHKASIMMSLTDMTLLSDWMLHYCYRIAIGLAATLFFISFFEYLSGKIKVTALGRRICGWGTQTLGIYLYQTVIIELVMARWIKLDSIPAGVFDFIVTPLISLGILLLCLWLISLTKKSRWLSLLLLGTPLKREREAKGSTALRH